MACYESFLDLGSNVSFEFNKKQEEGWFLRLADAADHVQNTKTSIWRNYLIVVHLVVAADPCGHVADI